MNRALLVLVLGSSMSAAQDVPVPYRPCECPPPPPCVCPRPHVDGEPPPLDRQVVDAYSRAMRALEQAAEAVEAEGGATDTGLWRAGPAPQP